MTAFLRTPFRRTTVGLLVLVLGIAAAAFAETPKKAWPRPVKKAFGEIGTKECRDHVKVLSSDAFEGRAAGEDGARLAAEYIAMRFVENGIAPGGPGGSYFQRFPLLLKKSHEGELQHSNILRLVKEDSRHESFDLFEEWVPDVVSAELTTGGELRYVSAEAAAADALPEDLAGTVAVITGPTLVAELARTPPPPTVPPTVTPPVEKDPADGESEEDAEGSAEKAEEVVPAPRPLDRWHEAGVRALLVVTDAEDSEAFGEDRWPLGDRDIAARLPVLRLGSDASEKLLRKGRSTVERAEKSGEVSFKDWRGFVSVSRRGYGYGLGRNVVGMLRGTDPEIGDEMVVVGAHYDHVGYARDPRLTKGRSGEIHNGADDNASGTTGLIELSEAFATAPDVERARTLIFIAFDAEELGLVGSNHYVAHCPHPIEKTVAMLNMDMISRNGRQEMYYGKDARFPGLNRIVEGVGDYFGITLDTTGMDQYMERSDQAAFLAKGIPAVFLYGGDHPQYHTERDDFELIDPIKIQNIARFLFLCAYECANHRGGFIE